MKQILLISLLTLFLSAQGIKAQPVPLFTKAQTLALYDSLYYATEIDSIPWKGSVANCDAGTIPEEIYSKAEKRINFFRIMSGLDQVRLNPKLHADAQQAALILKANNRSTHFPDKSMKCYSQSGYDGCSRSNIGFADWKSWPHMAFITCMIKDRGLKNYYVGHRRWMLYSRLVEFGYGATNNSHAILTLGGTTDKPVTEPEFMSYPWNGHVPIHLIFPKWSFSIPESRNADFSNVEVTMVDSAGNQMEIELLKERKDFLDHTIVWIAKDMFTDREIRSGANYLEQKGWLDKEISVSVKNVVVDGKVRNYEYSVTPFKAKTRHKVWWKKS